MGMAASQARLLTITARLADNELRSQTINNAKMRLAAQSSRVSENYINALNNATMKFSNFDDSGNAISQDLTFNSLTAYSSYNNQYGLVNSAGLLLVSETDAANYMNAGGNLNAFLKSYGLEFTTTYFDELGAVKNAAYPAPFNNIPVDEMKGYYEAYGSYESSIEIQKYENSYFDYNSTVENLYEGGSEVLLNLFKMNTTSAPMFLQSTLNTNKINEDAEDGSLTVSGISEANTMDANIKLFLNAFTSEDNSYTNVTELNNGYNNIYNINNLVKLGLISDTVKNTLLSEIDYKSYPVTYDASGVPVSGGVYWGTNTTPLPAVGHNYDVEFYKENIMTKMVDESGNPVLDEAGKEQFTHNGYKYSFDDGLTINTSLDGIVTGWEYDWEGVSNSIKHPNYDPSKSYDLVSFLNLLQLESSWTDEDGTGTDYYRYIAETDAEGNLSGLKAENLIFDNKVLVGELNSRTESLLNALTSTANYEVFVSILKNETSPLTKYFVSACNPDKELESVPGESLNSLVDKYVNAKSTFFDVIFDGDTNYPITIQTLDKDGNELEMTFESSKAYVDWALTNNEIAFYTEKGEPVQLTAENLTDIDFVLQFVKEKGLRQSESFNTVIKEYMIDNLIAQYGEPKYTWVDKNDTANTGNADAKAQWYTNLFNRMTKGFKTLESGLCNSKEWIEYALEAGIATLEQVDKNFKWNGLNYKTCTKIIEETDDAAVSKAEAEYNRAMNDIEAKDNIYTMELKNIDTEHTALQQEYEVIKGVIDKNIARTFKFNQSA